MLYKTKITVLALFVSLIVTGQVFAGATTANGWYEEEEIYYILRGVEEGVTERGENDLYLIGGDRAYQANVARVHTRRAWLFATLECKRCPHCGGSDTCRYSCFPLCIGSLS